MRTRVFYVINLDKNRILSISVIFTGLILTAFATGYRMGIASQPQESITDSVTSDMSPDNAALSRNTGPVDTDAADVSAESTVAKQGLPDDAADRSVESEKKGFSFFSLFGFSRKEQKIPGSLSELSESRESETGSDAKSLHDLAISQTEPQVKKSESADREVKDSESAKDDPNPRAALLDSNSFKLSNVDSSKKTIAPEITETKPKTESAKKTPEPADYRFSFQIASYKDKSKADSMIKKMKSDGFDPFVEKSRDRFIIKAGHAAKKKDLWNLESRLKSNKYSYFLTEKK
jgi:cell division septation protein DedD